MIDWFIFVGKFTSWLPAGGDLQSDGGHAESRTNGGPVENVGAGHRDGDPEHGPEYPSAWVHAPELQLHQRQHRWRIRQHPRRCHLRLRTQDGLGWFIQLQTRFQVDRSEVI